MKILVVAAHPDDEVLGCGATMAKYSRLGNEVHTVIMGDGITSRYSLEELSKKEVVDQVNHLKDSALKIGELLGAKSTQVYGKHCCRFDQIPLLEMTKIIEENIQKIKPDIIYTHSPIDNNYDHTLLFKAVSNATRPMPHHPVKTVLLFEVLSSTEWNFRESFRPTLYENVSHTIQQKTQAMKIYEGEMRIFPHPRSEQAILTLAQKRGSEVGLEYAEAFEVYRDIKL